MRHPPNIPNLILALPARHRTPDILPTTSPRPSNSIRLPRPQRPRRLVHQIPDQHLAVIRSRSESAPAQGRPLDAVERARVAAQFEEGLAWLTDVQYTDDVGVLGEGGEEVVVVRGGCEPKKGRGVGEGLLG
jgi:hypothetical protein